MCPLPYTPHKMIDETIFVVLKQLIEYPSFNHESFIIAAKKKYVTSDVVRDIYAAVSYLNI